MINLFRGKNLDLTTRENICNIRWYIFLSFHTYNIQLNVDLCQSNAHRLVNSSAAPGAEVKINTFPALRISN